MHICKIFSIFAAEIEKHRIMKRFFSLFIIGCCFAGGAFAATLHVEQLQGTDFVMAVKQIGKLVISGSKLVFYDRQGEKLYTADMQKLPVVTFDTEAETTDPTGLDPVTPGSDPDDPSNPDGDDNPDQAIETIFAGDKDRIVVYPNPTSSMLIVSGASDRTTLRLYSLDGRLFKKAVGTTMNVEEVPNGNYLLQCENQLFKIIKQ